MSPPIRIFLRAIGLVLFGGSLVAMVGAVVVGPDAIAEQLGRSCRHNSISRTQWCSWRDVMGYLEMLPYLTLVGGVLLLAMRPDWVGRDEERSAAPAQGRGGLSTLGTVAVIALILVNFAGGFIYRASYSVVVHTRNAKEVLQAAQDRPEIQRPKMPAAKKAPVEPAAVATPHGLDRGSLLRADTFRKAIADVRDASPAGARLSSLRVAPDRIDAEVLAGGRTVRLLKPWDGPAKVASRAPTADGDLPIVSFAALDTGAPQRIARATESPDDLAYLVLLDVAGLRWNGFMDDGTQITATPDGHVK